MDSYNLFIYQLQLLQRFRNDISTKWNDAASRDINLRYLNPHEEDCEHMVNALMVQNEMLDNLKARIVGAEKCIGTARSISNSIMAKCRDADEDEQRVYAILEIADLRIAEVSDAMPTLTVMLNQASQCCHGVPVQ